MATTTTTATTATVELVRADEPLGVAERAAIAGFLAGYPGNTLTSYTTDLRLFVEWCITNDVRLFQVRRAHLEIFGRQMEADGRMRSSNTSGLSLSSATRRAGTGRAIADRTADGATCRTLQIGTTP